MGVFSEIDMDKKEQSNIMPLTRCGTAEEPTAEKLSVNDTRQQIDEDDLEPDALESDGDELDEGEDAAEPEKASENKELTPAQKKAEHEAAEAKRKAEWEAKQAKKKSAAEKALQELFAMSDDDVAGASVKKTGDDLERLTRRNMKMCVTEVIQTMCLEDPSFARFVCHPSKSLINCFKYINKKAEEFIKAELEMRGEKMSGAIGEDVPDDLCYKWAEEYFRDLDAEIDKDKDDKFVPKTFYGGASPPKTKKKDPPKSMPESVKKSAPNGDQLQLEFGSVPA